MRSIHKHRDFKQEFPEILKNFPERKDSPEESPQVGVFSLDVLKGRGGPCMRGVFTNIGISYKSF
jgi:hypothetical protein